MLTKTEIGKLKRSPGGDKSLPMIFGALSDTSRLRILRVLLKNKDVCVSDMANILGVSVPAASHQLSVLETAGLVERLRKGKMTCFKIPVEDKTVKSIIDILNKVDGRKK